MVVICGHFNAFICEIFYCFCEVSDILVKVFIFQVVFVSMEIFEPMINTVAWPEVNKHNSHRLELINKIEDKFIVIFKGCECCP